MEVYVGKLHFSVSLMVDSDASIEQSPLDCNTVHQVFNQTSGVVFGKPCRLVDSVEFDGRGLRIENSRPLPVMRFDLYPTVLIDVSPMIVGPARHQNIPFNQVLNPLCGRQGVTVLINCHKEKIEGAEDAFHGLYPLFDDERSIEQSGGCVKSN